MGDDSETLDVIAVGAHPDDVEIACGGTLAALAKDGYRVGIVDLTNGEPTPLCPSPEVRLEEANAAAAALGIQKRIVLDLPNRKLFDSFEARVALASEFRRYRPRVVLGIGMKTPMASPDHWQAMQIFDAAVFYSRLSKWEQYFPDLPVHTITTQLYFPLSFDLVSAASMPHCFVSDISGTIEKKMESIACYKTQFSRSKQPIQDRVRNLSAAIGASAGYGFGEYLARTRPLGTTDLMGFLEDESRRKPMP